MKYSLRSLMNLRLLAYGSFVTFWGGVLLIKAIIPSDGKAMIYMVVWATSVAAVVGFALLLCPRKKLPNSSAPAPNPPKE